MTSSGWYERRDGGYLTTRPVPWEIGRKGSGLWITIPPGFKFDSSVPRWLWWVFDPHDPDFLKSACIHDWLLEDGYRRAMADAEWLDAARSEHAPIWRREVAFLLMQVRCAILGKWR